MIKSMTGFGRAQCELSNRKIQVEIRSLNSKQLDVNTRIPLFYKEKEQDLRAMLSKGLQRGKVDVIISFESLGTENIPQINETVFEAYYQQLSSISSKLNIGGNSDFIKSILSLPEVLKVEQTELDEQEWGEVKVCISEAIQAIVDYRDQEGKVLEGDIRERIGCISKLLVMVEDFEGQRLDRIKKRIKDSLEEIVDLNKIDENRFEQELIYYIEKLDVTEEKVRLQGHLDYFLETLEDNQPAGKKLAFILQEIGREINTLGSKANDADIQRIVINMKDELEKIKEQVLNVL